MLSTVCPVPVRARVLGVPLLHAIFESSWILPTADHRPESANPSYLNHLAATQMFDDPCFVAYLDYLQYFTRPEYTKFLTHVPRPGLFTASADQSRSYPLPTLKALQLLQQGRFRQDILSPDTVAKLRAEFCAVGAPLAEPGLGTG